MKRCNRMATLFSFAGLLWLQMLAFQACTPGEKPCEPQCGDRCGQDDGCGGQCRCGAGQVCDPSGRCLQQDCNQSCQDLGQTCGEVCGISCGNCRPNESCEEGRCMCQPNCDGTHCGPDGCGGECECPEGTVNNKDFECVTRSECTQTCESESWTCGTLCGNGCGTCGDNEMCVRGDCQDAVSCTDCPLRLYVLEQIITAGKVKGVVLALEHAPSADQSQPRMADIRIVVDQASDLVDLTVGPAITNADKALYLDPDTGKTWRKRADGAYQFLVYSVSNTHSLASGRMLTLSFALDADQAVSFSLQRRDQVFAPPAADQALQQSPYDQPVVVTP